MRCRCFRAQSRQLAARPPASEAVREDEGKEVNDEGNQREDMARGGGVVR